MMLSVHCSANRYKNMSEKNLAAVLYAAGDLRVEEISMPEMGEEDLLIRPHTTGICGTDTHFLHKGKVGSMEVENPMVLGHEGSGVVVGVGNKVKGFSVGDRIAMEPPISCWKCEFCKTGRNNLCSSLRALATPPQDGTLCRFMKHPARCCFKLPDSLSFEDGAFLEPLAVVIQGAHKANLRFGQNVLVLGAGPIGVMAVFLAKAAGAPRVVVTDVKENRLEMIRELGADYTLNVSDLSTDDVAKRIDEFLGSPADVVLDCVEVKNSMEHAIKCVKPGGSIAVVGLSEEEMNLPLFDVISKEINVVGSICYDARCYPIAIDLLSTGKIDLKKIPVAHYPLEQAVEAFKRAEQADVMKVFIHSITEGEKQGCNVF